MKKISIVALFAMFFVSLLNVSCTKENTPVSNNNNNNNNPVTGGVTSGDYWPLKTNNQWVYQAGNNPQVTTALGGTKTYGGNSNTYYEMSNSLFGLSGLGFNSETLIAKNGETYIQKFDQITTTQLLNGTTTNVSSFEIPILKDDLAKDQTWTGTVNVTASITYPVSYSMPISITYTGTILATGATETINNVSYANIIKSKIDIQIPKPNSQQTITTSSEIWYAKGIGPIKEIVSANGGTATESNLVSYTLN